MAKHNGNGRPDQDALVRHLEVLEGRAKAIRQAAASKSFGPEAVSSAMLFAQKTAAALGKHLTTLSACELPGLDGGS